MRGNPEYAWLYRTRMYFHMPVVALYCETVSQKQICNSNNGVIPSQVSKCVYALKYL